MILVNDEDEVRGRISSKISEESGFHVVGTAGNGYDALELIEKYSPDVVLTDIRMPYIDGIELATIIRREHPAIRVGFITGYNEFDYARQAIQLQVRSYLTKPLTEKDILVFLQELKSELDREYESRYSTEAMLDTYTRSLPVLVENGLSTLLISARPQLEHLVPQLKSYGIDLEAGSYLVGVVRIEKKADHWNPFEFEKTEVGSQDKY